MAISYTVDARHRIVWATFFESVTTDEMRQYFAAVERDGGHDPSFAHVVDWRDLASLPSEFEVHELAQLILMSVARRGGLNRRALLVRPGVQYGVARMLQILLDETDGLAELQLFADLESAREWVRSPRSEASAA